MTTVEQMKVPTSHRFLDEAGDSTFFKKGRILAVDLYDTAKYEGSRNYYTRERPLTAQNKLSPLLP